MEDSRVPVIFFKIIYFNESFHKNFRSSCCTKNQERGCCCVWEDWGWTSEGIILPMSPSTSFLLWKELHFSLMLSDIPSPALHRFIPFSSPPLLLTTPHGYGWGKNTPSAEILRCVNSCSVHRRGAEPYPSCTGAAPRKPV